jgi:hypothetical protein
MLRQRRQRVLRGIIALWASALLLVPLILSGHVHENGAALPPDACAVCAATHHSPGASTPVLPPLAPAFGVITVELPRVVAPSDVRRTAERGRAPPQPVSAFVA